MGIWAPPDSRVMSLGVKGSSGTMLKDSVSGGIVRALAWPDLFPFLSPFSLYGLSYCMPEVTSLISYCALS